MAQQPPAVGGEITSQALNDWFSYLDSGYQTNIDIMNKSRDIQFSKLDYQKKIAETDLIIEEGDHVRHVQGMCVDKENDRYYVSRQTGGSEWDDQKIYEYELSTNTLLRERDVPIEKWVYLEGLAHYKENDTNYFIVPVKRAGEFGIFNFDSGEMITTIEMEGSFKTSIDNNEKYFICAYHTSYVDDPNINETFSGAILYDLQSVKDGNPKIVKRIKAYHDDIFFPKTQTLTMIDDLLFLGQNDGNISVLNTRGDKIYSVAYDKAELQQMMGFSTIDPNADMENEGIDWVKENGKTYLVNGYTVRRTIQLVKMMDVDDGIKIKRSTESESDNGLMRLSQKPPLKLTRDNGKSVVRIGANDDFYDIVKDLTEMGFYTFFASSGADNTPPYSGSLRGTLQIDRLTNGKAGVISIISQDYNGVVWTNYYDSNTGWTGWQNVGNKAAGAPTDFDPFTAPPGLYETKSSINAPVGSGGAIRVYRITESGKGRRQIECYYNNTKDANRYYCTIDENNNVHGWLRIRADHV